jgi:hypothetical protein
MLLQTEFHYTKRSKKKKRKKKKCIEVGIDADVNRLSTATVAIGLADLERTRLLRRPYAASTLSLPLAMPPNRRGQAFDVALDNATPVLEFAGDVLNLVPVPGLSLVAKGLSVLLDGVKASRPPIFLFAWTMITPSLERSSESWRTPRVYG